MILRPFFLNYESITLTRGFHYDNILLNFVSYVLIQWYEIFFSFRSFLTALHKTMAKRKRSGGSSRSKKRKKAAPKGDAPSSAAAPEPAAGGPSPADVKTAAATPHTYKVRALRLSALARPPACTHF